MQPWQSVIVRAKSLGCATLPYPGIATWLLRQDLQEMYTADLTLVVLCWVVLVLCVAVCCCSPCHAWGGCCAGSHGAASPVHSLSQIAA